MCGVLGYNARDFGFESYNQTLINTNEQQISLDMPENVINDKLARKNDWFISK